MLSRYLLTIVCSSVLIAFVFANADCGRCGLGETGTGGVMTIIDPACEGDGGPPGTGGCGGQAATSSTASAGGAPPITECFLNVDCPTSWIPFDGCFTVHCDPTGKQTDTASPLVGCYLLAAPIDSPCDGPAGKGVCTTLTTDTPTCLTMGS